MIGTERLYGEITGSTATLAHLAGGADQTRPVPTCPDWTMRQLITHVGRAHRWATAIVTTRSAEPIPFRDVPDGKLPGDQREHADWLRVEAAGDEQVWTHLGPGPARYWARRMAHEQPAARPPDGRLAVVWLAIHPAGDRSRRPRSTETPLAVPGGFAVGSVRPPPSPVRLG